MPAPLGRLHLLGGIERVAARRTSSSLRRRRGSDQDSWSATNDLPMVGAVSRAGYRQLLESGVRIFEYGGLMMHAKTTVADGWSSRVGSTNLNVTGLLSDWEIDLVVEDRSFGAKMEKMFEEDLADSREVRLGGTARRPRAEPERHIAPAKRRLPIGPGGSGSRGSGSRAVASVTQAAGTAFREGGEDLQRYEQAVGVAASAGLLGMALLGARFPRLLAWPLAAAAGLVGTSGLLRTLRHPTDSKERRDDGDSSHQLLKEGYTERFWTISYEALRRRKLLRRTSGVESSFRT
jgi:hypothetical protein